MGVGLLDQVLWEVMGALYVPMLVTSVSNFWACFLRGCPMGGTILAWNPKVFTECVTAQALGCVQQRAKPHHHSCN